MGKAARGHLFRVFYMCLTWRSSSSYDGISDTCNTQLSQIQATPALDVNDEASLRDIV